MKDQKQFLKDLIQRNENKLLGAAYLSAADEHRIAMMIDQAKEELTELEKKGQ